MKIQRLSIVAISIASLVNIAGAVLNSLHLRVAFTLWIFSNSICAVYFYGTTKDWWKAEQTGEKSLMLMYLIFIGTATYGYLN